MRSANEIRQQFMDFFVRKHGHTAVPSSSVVPLDDPTLLFTNAGMNQFKDVFLGTGTRPYRRAVDSQKCIRAGGKHNDLEDVGRDTYHHTFFEMLGNWSFGDYFKKEAIAWAWELLTKDWGLEKSRLHATVFEGDAEQGLTRDDEAAQFWRTETDIEPSHIHLGSKKDNFWMMGDTGPCGPCSEIHIDRTPDRSGGQLVNKGDARVIEIWNLVFIQFNRDEKGVLHPLPAKHVDTGMGFERVTAVLQGKESNYDTDVFTPIMEAIGDVVRKKYGGRLENINDVAFRVIADHLRMLTFSITDGALPGNKGRGAVLRSVLRRAFRFGYQCFGQREPFIWKLVPALVGHMGGAYPELMVNPGRVQDIIKGEEADFLRTIERGLSLFDKAANDAAKAGGIISGKAVFDLHTTFGFPPDLTKQIAQERGLNVDESDYSRNMVEHRAASDAGKFLEKMQISVTGSATDDHLKWSQSEMEARPSGCVVLSALDESSPESKEEVEKGLWAMLLDRTCFYAEAGGQVGDKGTITTDSYEFTVENTAKNGNIIFHIGRFTRGEFVGGQTAHLKVSPERDFTRKNHTATHLLHWALHRVLGEHVEQRGSKVKPEEFTFDFSHTGPLTQEQMKEVERLVNEKIYDDLPVTWRELSIDEARKLPGVRAFFGDKYGDVVRVVEIGDGFSREFCGGTHLAHTGQAGFFTIVQEEAVGKGVRRLTCRTARGAVEFVQKELVDPLLALVDRLHCKFTELPNRVDSLLEENKKLQAQLKKGAATDLAGAGDRLLASATEVKGAKIVVGEVPAAPEETLRTQVDRIRQKAGSAVVVIGWAENGKVGLIAAVTDDLVKKGVKAGQLVGEAAKVVGGKGGGRPNMAQAGGKDPSKLGEALATARNMAAEQLGGG
jgi:alanyl-tRNA synthetase